MTVDLTFKKEILSSRFCCEACGASSGTAHQAPHPDQLTGHMHPSSDQVPDQIIPRGAFLLTRCAVAVAL